MKRIFLIHWNADEAGSYASELESIGCAVEVEYDDGGKAYKRIKESPPDVVIIYLTRLPSHGRETALALTTTATLSDLPMIFVGGAPRVVSEIKPLFPNARFVTQENLKEAIQEAAQT